MVILWPAFLMASVLEALVFVWVDPAQLRWFGDTPWTSRPRQFTPWRSCCSGGVIATAGALISLLEQTAAEVNRGAAWTASGAEPRAPSNQRRAARDFQVAGALSRRCR